MANDASALRMAEYKSLRAEILERIREANTLIITTAGGIGGAYAVMVSTFAKEPHLKLSHASNLTIISFLIIVWTPVAFAALGRIKSRDIWITLMHLAGQIRFVENEYYGSSPSFPGWENQMEINRNTRKPFVYRLAHPPYTSVYWGMIVTTLALALSATGYVIYICVRQRIG